MADVADLLHSGHPIAALERSRNGQRSNATPSTSGRVELSTSQSQRLQQIAYDAALPSFADSKVQ